jgi:hypothetical protein
MIQEKQQKLSIGLRQMATFTPEDGYVPKSFPLIMVLATKIMLCRWWYSIQQRRTHYPL